MASQNLLRAWVLADWPGTGSFLSILNSGGAEGAAEPSLLVGAVPGEPGSPTCDPRCAVTVLSSTWTKGKTCTGSCFIVRHFNGFPYVKYFLSKWEIQWFWWTWYIIKPFWNDFWITESANVQKIPFFFTSNAQCFILRFPAKTWAQIVECTLKFNFHLFQCGRD